MTILLIRHTPPSAAPDAAPLPARVAGHRLACHDCDSLPALVRCLQAARRSRPAWVLIATTAVAAPQWARYGAAVRAALDALPAPYIEMASNDDDALDERLHPQHAPAARVVCGRSREEACQLSLAIAARRLQPAVGSA
ncbi:hypothetical protein ACLB90_10725 [Stenotrophomonas sp. LGBM10]|uniref:hypothetical protein n=1 Tax=Stenotrophomonas sp. LGBM10 TaxID=3390038 RepID=UPI00398AC197